MRSYFDEHPKIVIGITTVSLVLLVIVAMLVIPKKDSTFREYEKEWFYNLDTCELFVADASQIQPTLTPAEGQPAIARAYVLAYVYDPNESERFIGFLEVPNPNAQRHDSAEDQPTTDVAERWGRGKLIQMVGGKQWYPANSSIGKTILAEVFTPDENGEMPNYCRPK